MPLKVIQDLGNDVVQSELMLKIEKWYDEVRVILPNLPENLQIFFLDQNSENIMPESGIGGIAYNNEIMSLGFDLNFKDKKEQLLQLKSTIFHEALHIAQGHTLLSNDAPLLESMVYEGLATVFEREIVGIDQPYGKYPKDVSIIEDWVDRISLINPPVDFESEYSRWAFYDSDEDEAWKLYRVGTWYIDQVLSENKNLSIIDLTKMTAKEILNLKR